MSVFQEFQKIARLSRDCVVTEKIDGTNAQVEIVPLADVVGDETHFVASNDAFAMAAGSRSRYITPEADNFGFAKWVKANADELFTLGPGRHFGEWWGSGIQRGYGLPQGEKRFSLFNVARWHRAGGEVFVSVSGDPRKPTSESTDAPACCHVVPVVYRGTFDSFMGHSEDITEQLRTGGSWAAPGFMKPEGVVIFHTVGGYLFKKTLDKDDAPKSLIERATRGPQ